MTERNTLHQIAGLLGVDPEDLDINISESDDDQGAVADTNDDSTTDDDTDGTPEYEDRPERYRSLTPREYANLTRNNSNGVERFIEARRNPKPPAHRDTAQVRELIEQRKVEREEERRRAAAPMPKSYDEDDRPAWSNLAPGYMAQQADFRRQHDEHVARVKADHQQRLDEVAARREADAEASQDIAAEIEALRKARRREEQEAAKRAPRQGHI